MKRGRGWEKISVSKTVIKINPRGGKQLKLALRRGGGFAAVLAEAVLRSRRHAKGGGLQAAAGGHAQKILVMMEVKRKVDSQARYLVVLDRERRVSCVREGGRHKKQRYKRSKKMRRERV